MTYSQCNEGLLKTLSKRVSSKLEECNFKGGVRLASSDETQLVLINLLEHLCSPHPGSVFSLPLVVYLISVYKLGRSK